jgi:TatD DNase family protein
VSIDMHCHLDLYPEPFKVAEECKKRGTYVLSVTTTPKAWEGTCKLAQGSQRIRTSLGLHPQIAHQRFQELELFDTLLPEARYVGEIGLDGGAGFKDHWDIQLKVFRHILRSINRAGGRIMTLHSRASVGPVLDELAGIDGTPILHWFTGTKNQLKKAVDMGCWFSVGPAMLNTKNGAELAALIPRNRILTETDGPFASYNSNCLMPWDSDIAQQQLSGLWQKIRPSISSKRTLRPFYRQHRWSRDQSTDFPEGKRQQQIFSAICHDMKVVAVEENERNASSFVAFHPAGYIISECFHRLEKDVIWL